MYLNREIKNVGLDTMDNLDRFQKLISTDWEISISIGLDFWDLQAEQSILYLDREIKKFGLDTMDNLDRFQKLILTDQEITISIGLEFRDPQA